MLILADAAAQSTLGWHDYLVPAGAILAAAVAAFVAWRNGNKSPHERLETLVSTYADWPDNLPGKTSLEEPIAVVLEQVRRKEGMAEAEPVSPTSREILREVDRSARFERANLLVALIAVVGAIVGALISGLSLLKVHDVAPPAIIQPSVGVIQGPSGEVTLIPQGGSHAREAVPPNSGPVSPSPITQPPPHP